MKKTLITIIVLVLLALVAVLGFMFSHQPTQSTTQTNGTTFPTGTSTSSGSIQNTNAYTVKGADGTTIGTNDFLSASSTAKDPVNSGYYYLGNNTFGGQRNMPYMIEYIASTQYFNIELLQEPLSASRVAAEDYLMQQLGLTEAQMCNLNYTISAPNSVNEVYGGEDLRFSFCQGAEQLPQ